MNKRTVKTKTETKGKTTTKTTTKVQVEPGKRVEETIVIQRKVNPYIDNYSYKETKNIYNQNPRFQVTVEHKRKGDIIGGGSFEETSSQRQVFSQGGNRPKLPEQNQKLRGTKSEAKTPKQQTTTTTTKKTTTTTKTTTTKEKNPVASSGRKEKITETTVKRRSEGTGSKTETKTQTKTTTTGVRGQPTTSSTTTKTTTKTTKIGGGDDKGEAAGASSIRRKFGKK